MLDLRAGNSIVIKGHKRALNRGPCEHAARWLPRSQVKEESFQNLKFNDVPCLFKPSVADPPPSTTSLSLMFLVTLMTCILGSQRFPYLAHQMLQHWYATQLRGNHLMLRG